MRGVGVFVLAAGLLACDRGGAGAGPAAPAGEIDAARLYQRQCAVCHGATGAGDGPSAGMNQAANLRDPGFHANNTDEDIALVIREGRGLMPPWRHLGDERIDALVAFVRTLEQEE